MRIGIDVRYLSHGLVGGVHTYLTHLVPALVNRATDHQVLLYADTKRPFELANLPSNVAVRYLRWSSPLSSIYNDLTMGRQMARDRLDVVHFPANYGFGPPGVPTVITLHDAINILPLRTTLRDGTSPRAAAMIVYLHYLTRLALRKVDLVLTVSEHARRDIAARSGIEVERIVAVPHAPPPGVQRVTEPRLLRGVRERLGLPERFVLADALKNPGVLVRAWGRLPDELKRTRRIVFFSRRTDVLPVVHDAVASGEALLLVRPSSADLMALYSMAEAFVFPSWIEGFGIPVLEAMACGAPVIASDRGAIPEVAGGAALLTDAEDDDALARHIARVLDGQDTAGRLRELGFRRAARFSWAVTAERILSLYERVVSRGASIPIHNV